MMAGRRAVRVRWLIQITTTAICGVWWLCGPDAFATQPVDTSAVSVTLRTQAQVTVTLHDTFVEPARISAKKGTPVSLRIVNAGGKTHNLVIPAFYIFTQNLRPGETATASFTPDKTGAYSYYSDTGGKPESGIQGTLVVSP